MRVCNAAPTRTVWVHFVCPVGMPIARCSAAGRRTLNLSQRRQFFGDNRRLWPLRLLVRARSERHATFYCRIGLTISTKVLTIDTE